MPTNVRLRKLASSRVVRRWPKTFLQTASLITTLLVLTYPLHQASGMALNPIRGQASGSDLVAILYRVGGKVEVERAKTSQWLPIKVQTLIGAGDSIRTDSSGSAQVIAASGLNIAVKPGSAVQIGLFSGSDQQFKLTMTISVGILAIHSDKLNKGSSGAIHIDTPDSTIQLGNAILALRVEPSGRSTLLVTQGSVDVHYQRTSRLNGGNALQSTVAAGQGVRTEQGVGWSFVIPAYTFGGLDLALDGCPATLTLPLDVALNVRSGPNLTFPRIGRLSASNQSLTVLGITINSGWYRIPFKGGQAWISAPTGLHVDYRCPKLPQYLPTWAGEDVSRYVDLDSDVQLTSISH